MNSRTIITIVLSLILICLVMGVSGLLAFNGFVNPSRYSTDKLWQADFANAQSMKIIDLTGDGQDDLFIQNTQRISLLSPDGQTLGQWDFDGSLATSMGDVTGDGVEDIIVFESGTGANPVQIIANGQPLTSYPLPQMNGAARVALIRFAQGAQIVLGDSSGQLMSLSTDGVQRWQAGLGSEEVRGLDDAKVGGQTFLAAAVHDGTVTLFDAQGMAQWTYFLPGGLRRLRSYDLNGDGTSELALGGENGGLVLLNAADGSELFNISVGQAVSEIRDAEVNGDPSSRELVVGGKDGGVWAYDLAGTRLWAKNASEKVTEIAGVDLNADGLEEILIGDEGGDVGLYTGPNGDYFPLMSVEGFVNRIDIGRLSASRQLAVAGGERVQVLNLVYGEAPALRFTPLAAGLIASLGIVVAAWLIATHPPKPTLKTTIEDQSPESLLAQRRMLKENIADVERLKSGGEMTASAYLSRLKGLRSQLADNEAAMQKAHVKFIPETMTCPNCGGSLPLGLDRCDYCGQTVIT